MRIILISNMYPSGKDKNYGIFVKNFKEGMETAGANFPGICVIRGRKGGKFMKILAYVKLCLSISFTLLFKSSDIIYVHYPLQTASFLRLFRIFTTRPFVLNFHGSDLFCSDQVNTFFRKESEKLAKEVEMLVVPSEYFKEQIIKIMQVEKEKIVVSPSAGINFNVFNKSSLEPSEKREFSLGFISRIDKEKGWDTYLKAIKILKDKGKLGNKKCLMLGSGPQDNEKEKMIADFELNENIEAVGSTSQKELARHYKSMELFVFPSARKAESLGLVGLEAMACGVPVLGADNGGIANYIKDGENGLLFEKKNAEELASKITCFFEMTKVQRMSIEEKAYETAALYENSRVSMNLANKLRRRFLPGEVNGKI